MVRAAGFEPATDRLHWPDAQHQPNAATGNPSTAPHWRPKGYDDLPGTDGQAFRLDVEMPRPAVHASADSGASSGDRSS
jgi:hypothetical protein